MAAGAIAATQDAGLRVPDDLAVVGFDDIPLDGYIRPSLTSMALPAYAMGMAAMRQVLWLLREGPETDELITFQARLVVRASSGNGRGHGPGSLEPVLGESAQSTRSKGETDG